MRDLKKNPINTLFLGTSWESVETLKVLNNDPRYNIVGVITKEDALVGRKKILTPSLVKKFAIKNNIEVFHTNSKREDYKKALEIFKPELIVCKAFGEILPEFFIEYPKYKSINIHFSLLPKFRGAIPIQKAILEGEKKTGITIMLMSNGLDEGDILKRYEEIILEDDTNITLRNRLVDKSIEVLGGVLEEWVMGKIRPTKQDNKEATYCWQREISKENAEIIWADYSANFIDRMVRALVPWPVAWTKYDGKRMKIFDVEIVELNKKMEPGKLFINGKDLLFSTKDKNKYIKVNELQIEGKGKIVSEDFINAQAFSKPDSV